MLVLAPGEFDIDEHFVELTAAVHDDDLLAIEVELGVRASLCVYSIKLLTAEHYVVKHADASAG
jgi:hypothetical protein